jgi:hypothetical protein
VRWAGVACSLGCASRSGGAEAAFRLGVSRCRSGGVVSRRGGRATGQRASPDRRADCGPLPGPGSRHGLPVRARPADDGDRPGATAPSSPASQTSMCSVASCSDARRSSGCSASMCACRTALLTSSVTSNRTSSSVGASRVSCASHSATAARASPGAAVVGAGAAPGSQRCPHRARRPRRAVRVPAASKCGCHRGDLGGQGAMNGRCSLVPVSSNTRCTARGPGISAIVWPSWRIRRSSREASEARWSRRSSAR